MASEALPVYTGLSVDFNLEGYVERSKVIKAQPSRSHAPPGRSFLSTFLGDNTTRVFVKVQEKGPKFAGQIKRSLNELRMHEHRALIHPNIPALHGAMNSHERVMFVFEHIDGGDLHRQVTVFGKLSEDATARMTRQVCSALVYVHSFAIFHGDVKLENILIRKQGRPQQLWEYVLADWEMADFDGVEKRGGTLEYAAPELFCPRGWCTRRSDMWALGTTMYGALTGNCALGHFETPETRAYQLHNGSLALPLSWSMPLKVLMLELFSIDPAKRPTAAHVLSGSWVNMYQN